MDDPLMSARRTGVAAVMDLASAPFVFVVAFVARLGIVYAGGGSLRDSPSYDTSVYYAAADALVHGRLPYRDFTLLHPPGLMLALTPFAALGRLTTDHTGFVVGCLAWMALGATDAVLVVLIARRLQLGSTAALIGGLGYAVWFESARSEYALRLEPLGNLFVLLGVLAFVVTARSGSRTASVLCGVALGAATSVKIWYLVPLLIVLAWHLVEHRPRRQLVAATLGAAACLLAVNGPFFLWARGRMWQMIVDDQVGRNSAGANPIMRVAAIASSGRIGVGSSVLAVAVVTVLGACVFVALCVLAWRSRAARIVVGLLVGQLVALVLAPSYFPYYSDYLAPATALTVAVAASVLLAPGRIPANAGGRAPHRRVLAAVAWLPVAVVAVSALAIDVFTPMHAVTRAPNRSLLAATASARCVQSDTPMALIQLDVLSRDLAHHCQVWVDVTGRTYGGPLKPTGTVHGTRAVRATYLPWQRALRSYLTSGDAVVVLQPKETGISRHTLTEVTRGAVLGRSGAYVVHRT